MINNTDKFVIYHNPRCSKSREALALMQQRGIEPRIVEYLKTPLTQTELREVIKKLGIKPEGLLRKGENVFMEKFSDRTLSDEEWIVMMVDNPVLIERPIVIHRNRAVIGRPPERLIELF